MIGHADEARGKIDAEDLGATAGQFKRTASHRAAQIQRPGLWRQTGDVETLAHATDRELERVSQ